MSAIDLPACDECSIGEPVVEHTVQPFGFLRVAFDRVGNPLRRVLSEVM